MVGVAQLVEHLVVVQDVAGSSPVTHPKVRGRLVLTGRPLRYLVQQPELLQSARVASSETRVLTPRDRELCVAQYCHGHARMHVEVGQQ